MFEQIVDFELFCNVIKCSRDRCISLVSAIVILANERKCYLNTYERVTREKEEEDISGDGEAIMK